MKTGEGKGPTGEEKRHIGTTKIKTQLKLSGGKKSVKTS
jgi:hypothetical protein